MGYEVYLETVKTKIIRTDYRVFVKLGHRASEYLEAFTNIPPDARLVDEEDNGGVTTMVFRREEPEGGDDE